MRGSCVVRCRSEVLLLTARCRAPGQARTMTCMRTGNTARPARYLKTRCPAAPSEVPQGRLHADALAARAWATTNWNVRRAARRWFSALRTREGESPKTSRARASKSARGRESSVGAVADARRATATARIGRRPPRAAPLPGAGAKVLGAQRRTTLPSPDLEHHQCTVAQVNPQPCRARFTSPGH